MTVLHCTVLYVFVLVSFVCPSHFVSRPEHHWRAREAVYFSFTQPVTLEYPTSMQSGYSNINV